MGSSNKETIKQQLESIAKPGINVAAFKTVSLPSQIEKQTLIYRTDASNDYLKMCFMEDFDEMPNKIMREASGSSAPSLPSPPQLQRGYKHRLRHRISTCSFIFSNTTGIAKKKKSLPMNRGKTIWRCLHGCSLRGRPRFSSIVCMLCFKHSPSLKEQGD